MTDTLKRRFSPSEDEEREELLLEERDKNDETVGSGEHLPDYLSTYSLDYKRLVESSGGAGDDSQRTQKEEKKEKAKTVGLGELFRFADATDEFLMFFGTLSSILLGSANPLMIVVFGHMMDMFIASQIWSNWVHEMYAQYNISQYTNATPEQIIQHPVILSPVLMFIPGGAEIQREIDQKSEAGRLLDQMSGYAIYFTIIGCGVLVTGYFAIVCWQSAAIRQGNKIRTLFFHSVLSQDMSWFDTHATRELSSKLSDDVNKIQFGIGDKMGILFQCLSSFVVGLTVGFLYAWKLTLVILALGPVMALTGSLMGKLGAIMTAKEVKAYAKAGAIAEEVLTAIQTVTAYGGQEKEFDRYTANLDAAKAMGIKKSSVKGAGMGLVWLVIFAATGLTFWVGSHFVLEDEYTGGEVFLVLFAVMTGLFSLGNAAPNLAHLANARGAASSVYTVIDSEPNFSIFSKTGERPEPFKGNIEFKDVVFAYPSNKTEKVLAGLNMKVNVGQTMALVGSSGCGKSTTVQLIQRFYDPLEGAVLIDGTDIRELNLEWLRRRIGVVSQEPVLFDTTIEENIRYGRQGVTQEEIEKAAREANAHDFIFKLPKRYGTVVGGRVQLSIGQRQRISIARALIRDPQILLLDEATSALDAETQSAIDAALNKAKERRSTLVVANRLSTARKADIVYCLDKGKVAECGAHEELMKNRGIYYHLVTNQVEETGDKDVHNRLDLSMTSAQLRPEHITDEAAKYDELFLLEEERDDYLTSAPVGRLAKINSSEWCAISFGCICSVIAGLAQPVFGVILAEVLGVYSDLDKRYQKEQIDQYTIEFVLLGVLCGIAMLLQGCSFGTSGEALTQRLRQMTFTASLRQEISFFDDPANNVGALCTRLSSDASAAQGATGVRLGSILQATASIVGGLAIGFIFSWQLTLLLCAFAPFVIFGSVMEVQMLSGQSVSEKASYEPAGKVVMECLDKIRTVAQLDKEQDFFDEYCRQLRKPYQLNLKTVNVQGMVFSFSQSIIYFSFAGRFMFGAFLIDHGKLTYVNMFKVVQALTFGAMGVGQACTFAPDYAKAKTSASRIFQLLDREPSIDNYSEKGDVPPYSGGSVQFDQVFFSYPTRPQLPVLNGLTMEVHAGQTVALVGRSGCGKSAVIKLLERFYDPLVGDVKMDDRCMNGLRLQWMRRQIGLVSQEPTLFATSIRENIAYGDLSREISMSEVENVARQANIHSFISELPQGYETIVGPKGTQLSWSQKQRIAIARTMIRNPKILLLDEATSLSDRSTEKLVQEALGRARKGRTSIVLAGRRSTLHNADCILVIHNGRVAEKGTHSQLLQRRGIYYRLNSTHFH